MDTIWKITILVTLIGASWGVYLGLTKKAVFYMDTNDLFESFSGWIVIIISALLAMFLQWSWVIKVGCAVAGGLVIYTTYTAYNYNMKNLAHAIPIGLAKVLLGLLYVLTWLQAIDPGGQSASEKRRNRSEAFVIIGILTPVLYKLVNGYDVYEQNGWNLPNLD